MNKQPIKSIKFLCEKLWEFEHDNNLLDLKINNIYIWQLVRFRIFKNLTTELEIYGQAHSTSKNINFNKKLKRASKLIFNAIVKNPGSGNYTTDFLIFDHPRKVNINGENVDIYTYNFIDKYKNMNFDVIESPYLGEHVTSNNQKNRKYRDREILLMLAKKNTVKLNISESEELKIKNIEKAFKCYFDFSSIEFYPLVIEQMKRFIHGYDYYTKLFKKRKPKCIYLLVSYEFIPIIAAAKDLGIKVIEFQHGVITDYHFGYNFSDSIKKIKYLPDKLLTFGDYWGRTKRFPKQMELEVYGFPYLNQQLERYKDIPKKKKQILFISQGTIGKELAKLALNISRNMPDYHFIFKLHPGEFDRWRSEYTELSTAAKFENFEVIDNNKINLYRFLAESDYQIGVYSTAIFEGLTLGCKTVLFNLPGIEYMKDLINQGIVEVADNVEEATYLIENYETKLFSRAYFFKGS